MKIGDVVKINFYGDVKTVNVVTVSDKIFIYIDGKGRRGWGHKESVVV